MSVLLNHFPSDFLFFLFEVNNYYSALPSYPTPITSLLPTSRNVFLFRLVNTEDSEKVFKFYMFVWKIFYLCYLLLPLLALGKVAL